VPSINAFLMVGMLRLKLEMLRRPSACRLRATRVPSSWLPLALLSLHTSHAWTEGLARGAVVLRIYEHAQSPYKASINTHTCMHAYTTHIRMLTRGARGGEERPTATAIKE
jgi:hypothetical protein